MFASILTQFILKELKGDKAKINPEELLYIFLKKSGISVLMDDTPGTGTVFCCRADENIFGNLRIHFGVKMVHVRSEIAISDIQS